MFGLTQDELSAGAQRIGFARNALEKALRMLDIMATLKVHPAFQGMFVLKGGTALNLFFLDMPRLSIDLDLNYVGALAAPEMQQDRERIGTEIHRAFGQEYGVGLTKDAYALSQFGLKYTTLAGSRDSLRIDINYLLRQPILPSILRRCRQLDPDLEFLCLSSEELVAGKIIALLARYTARDLFDVYQIALSPLTLDKTVLRSLVIFFGLVSRFNVLDLLEVDFSRVTRGRIRNDLVPMLKIGEYPDRDDMAHVAGDFLGPLSSLAGHEIRAIAGFYESGRLDLETLIPHKDLHRRMSTSPALAWKTRNIVRQLRAKRSGSEQ